MNNLTLFKTGTFKPLKKLGIPYKGSKRTLAPQLLQYMLEQNPKATHFYDMFGGGGAMSLDALQETSLNVIYNEYDPAVVNLFKFLMLDDKKDFTHNLGNVLPDVCYDWVSREKFVQHLDDDSWYGGLVRCVWSFGNNGKNYLFGKDIEDYKRLAHLIVVFKDVYSLKQLSGMLNVVVPEKIFDYDSVYERRIFFSRFMKTIDKGKNFQQLQQLERLQQVPILSPIETTIIYCDPPYENTGEYKHKFDSQKFYEWFGALPYPAYMSSYDAPFECVKEIFKKSSMSATTRTDTVERLYVNH